MTSASPTPSEPIPDPVAKTSRPDPINRLHVPPRLADTTVQEAEQAVQSAPAEPVPDAKRRATVKPYKRIGNYIAAIFKLGRTERMAKEAWRIGQTIEHRVAETEARSAEDHLLQTRLRRDLDQFEQDMTTRLDVQSKSALSVLSRSMSDLTARFDRLMMREGGAGGPRAQPSGASQGLPVSEGFEAFKDQFYHRLENQYRGSRAEIAKRLRIYLPDVEAAVARTGGKPVLDLGCGRGEWLSLLAGAGITAQGVDTNVVQISEARDEGLDARLGDAVTALHDAKDNSLSVISAHHLIEHLPFDVVAWLTREALRVLAPGGVLMFETPNTRNVLVGATTFHTDPTHLKPMPEQVMSVLLDTAGFDPVDIRHLNAHARFDEFMDKPDMNDELAFLLFGPQDLAILGHKPKAES